MYIWKCWRDTRWFFVVFILIAAFPMSFEAFVTRGDTAILDAGSIAVQSCFSLIVTAAAYALATICAIQEFTNKTAHFLFTKPRSRAYFVWMSWLIGFSELIVVAGVNLFVGWLVLAHHHVHFFFGRRTTRHYPTSLRKGCDSCRLPVCLHLRVGRHISQWFERSRCEPGGFGRTCRCRGNGPATMACQVAIACGSHRKTSARGKRTHLAAGGVVLRVGRADGRRSRGTLENKEAACSSGRPFKPMPQGLSNRWPSLRGRREVCASAKDGVTYAAPWLQSDGCVRA